jgi:uncharacterized protein DUF6923
MALFLARRLLTAAAIGILAGCTQPPLAGQSDFRPDVASAMPSPGALATAAPTGPRATLAPVAALAIRRVTLPGQELQSPFRESLAVAGNAIWVQRPTSWPETLARIDADTGQVTVTSLPLPVRLVAGNDGTLWAIGPYGGAPGPTSSSIYRIDLTTGVLRRIVTTAPADLAVGLGSIWTVTSGHVEQRDAGSGRLLASRAIAMVQPQVACGALWGSSGDPLDSTLKRVDPATGVVSNYAASGPILERRDGCWAWIQGGIERVWPRPAVTVLGASSRLVWFEDSSAWLRPYGAFQRWDPGTGGGVGTTWRIDPSDINPVAKIGDDGRIVTAAGHVWLITAFSAVEYDIPAE